MPEKPFVRDTNGTIVGIEVHDYIWLFDKESGWTLCLKNDVNNPNKCKYPPNDYVIPSNEQNNQHSIIWHDTIIWDDTLKTPVFYNVTGYQDLFPDSRLDRRTCYFYFGNPDPVGNDYPAGTISKEELAFLKDNKEVFVLKIVNKDGPVWGPIKYRLEDRRDAGLAFYGPTVSIFAKRRRGGNRSLRKRYRKRRQTLRRTRR